MWCDVDILTIPFVPNVHKTQCPQCLDKRHRRLLRAGYTGALQIIKTIRYIVFDSFIFTKRAPAENQKMPLAQPIQLVLEQIICQFHSPGHTLTKTISYLI